MRNAQIKLFYYITTVDQLTAMLNLTDVVHQFMGWTFQLPTIAMQKIGQWYKNFYKIFYIETKDQQLTKN